MKTRASASPGSVLVVVLWASLGLVSVSLLFGHSMLMNYRGVDNDVAGHQAAQAIEGGLRYAKTLLTDLETRGTLPDLTTYEAEAVAVGDAQFWLLGRADGDASMTEREYALVDEAAKLNLNTVPPEVLETLPGMTPDLAQSIVDWRDAANAGSGSTDIKGGPFESIDELALVPGMTREILYGEDANQNGVLDAAEDDADAALPYDNSDGKLDPGLAEYLTVFTREPKNGLDGTTARLAVGDPAFPQKLPTLMLRIIERSGSVPSPATSVIDILRSITPPLDEAEMDELEPYLGVSDPQAPGEVLLDGRVNVNTASATVLTALLDDPNLAEEIINARIGRGTPSTGFGWVLALLPPNLPPGARFLTGSTSCVAADIAAVGRHGRGYRRTRAVFDLTADTPRIVYRRDLSPLGWALGREVREQLALRKNLP